MTLLGPKVAAAKAVGRVVRAAGRGGGTSLPGKVLTRLEPHAIGLLGARLEHGSAVISATNGKTTTAAMTAAILERTGETLVHNRAGANMAGGVASSLADASRRGGRALTGRLGLFEVDEFWLAPVVAELSPRALLLSNLFRDQLDRYGELEIIADRWADVVASSSAALVLNADDPLIADLGRAREPAYFGVEDDTLAFAELQHAADSKHCRRCGHAYVYDAIYLAHLGRYHCPNCGNRRPDPVVVARSVELRGIRSAAFTLATPGGRARGSSSRCPASTTSTTRSARRRCRWSSARRSTRWSRGWRAWRPRSGARRRSTSAAGRRRSCSSRTRPARTRSCARCRSRRSSSTCSGC